MANHADQKKRVDALRERLIGIGERAVTIMEAAAKAPLLANPEDMADMTREEQSIAAGALLPPKEAPFYLHAMAKIVGGAAAVIAKPEEAPKPVLNVNIVRVAQSIDEWQSQRKVLHDPIAREAEQTPLMLEGQVVERE